ncbi:hypothetical protein COV93_04405 [Candidatus Woesearchaeota archaeon CG11_big_fil_rev_8_21_14_0_20_43_8]|nr:MAG: hypothetical protein COV93_04405 [Candidatus Woesearchaeota archaeon CG11_big_fil_rev_8_21_14_0_20_43_8]PIO06763.1 MAG: hypothetical protein COT47_02840 [Candidatus Woesearchaeota archaeon CG08_land_8_20_14_0_20_43_7]
MKITRMHDNKTEYAILNGMLPRYVVEMTMQALNGIYNDTWRLPKRSEIELLFELAPELSDKVRQDFTASEIYWTGDVDRHNNPIVYDARKRSFKIEETLASTVMNSAVLVKDRN